MSGRRRRGWYTKAGPLRVTKADGTVEVRGAYDPWELAKIVAGGSRRRGGARDRRELALGRPDEADSSEGGGA